MNIEKGQLYSHYKGKTYEVLAVGKHSETLEDFVVYQAQYDDKEFGNNAIWVRPYSMFIAEVIVDGKSIPRFHLRQ